MKGNIRPTCTSLLEAGIEHASSEGGLTKVEELYIYEGYWRATKTSTIVNKCFNTKACTGGITDASDYCLSGYEGRCERGLVRDKACVVDVFMLFPQLQARSVEFIHIRIDCADKREADYASQLCYYFRRVLWRHKT